MSVQVSYKKQFLFGLIMMLIVFAIVEIFTNTVIKSYVINGCSDRLHSSEVYSTYSISKLTSICADTYNTIVFMSDDRSQIVQFPSQHSSSVNINSMGLRGDEISLEKQKDVVRILMLGGSTTFGYYSLDDDSTIPSFLQKKLNESSDVTFEVINGGHWSAASAFETKFLENNLELQPDIVIVYDGYNEITTPLPNDISDDKTQLQMFIKQLDFYSYTPRAITKILHEINSNQMALFSNDLNTVTANYNDEDYVVRSDKWGQRWTSTCDTMLSDELKIIVFLQPILGSSERTMSEYKENLIHENAKQDLDHYYLYKEQLSKIDSHCTSAIDISNVFKNNNVPLFTDLVHTGSYANEIIAEKIYEKITPIIIEDIP